MSAGLKLGGHQARATIVSIVPVFGTSLLISWVLIACYYGFTPFFGDPDKIFVSRFVIQLALIASTFVHVTFFRQIRLSAVKIAMLPTGIVLTLLSFISASLFQIFTYESLCLLVYVLIGLLIPLPMIAWNEELSSIPNKPMRLLTLAFVIACLIDALLSLLPAETVHIVSSLFPALSSLLFLATVSISKKERLSKQPGIKEHEGTAGDWQELFRRIPWATLAPFLFIATMSEAVLTFIGSSAPVGDVHSFLVGSSVCAIALVCFYSATVFVMRDAISSLLPTSILVFALILPVYTTIFLILIAHIIDPGMWGLRGMTIVFVLLACRILSDNPSKDNVPTSAHLVVSWGFAAMVLVVGSLCGFAISALSDDMFNTLQLLVSVAIVIPICSFCILVIVKRPVVPDAQQTENISLDKAHKIMRKALDEQLAEFAARFGLSKREVAVFECMLRGESAQLIAQNLTIAESTVKTHLKHIYSKLGVNNHKNAIALFNEYGDIHMGQETKTQPKGN